MLSTAPQFISDIVSMGLALSCPSWHTQLDAPTPPGCRGVPGAVSREGCPMSRPVPGCPPAGGGGAAAMQQGWGRPQQERPDWSRAKGGRHKNKQKPLLSRVW